MALSAIWIAVASLIATFDITKAIDENGKVIEPSYEFLSEFVWYVPILKSSNCVDLDNNYFSKHAPPIQMLHQTAV